jgi:hypothetical protein
MEDEQDELRARTRGKGTRSMPQSGDHYMWNNAILAAMEGRLWWVGHLLVDGDASARYSLCEEIHMRLNLILK